MSTMSASKPSGVTVSPFTDNPDAPVFVETEMHRRAVAQARFGIEQGSGLVVITGEPGSGKSAVLDRTVYLSMGENSAIVRMSANEVGGESLEAVILRVLRAGEPGIDPDAGIEDALIHCREGGVTPALLIDDADDLDDVGFKTLYRIAGFEKDGDPLFRIVIAGRPALRSLFYRDDMSGLRHLMATSSQLGPLGREDVELYVDDRIRSAGFASEIIPTVDFLDALAVQSGGNPGRINKLASRAITQAGLSGRTELFAVDLEEVAIDTASVSVDDIEDAEVIATHSADDVAATQPSGKASAINDGLDPNRPVTVTDLNAAIEQLGEAQPQAASQSEEASLNDTNMSHQSEASDDIDVWEPVSQLTSAEEERLDDTEAKIVLDTEHPLIAEMQSHVNDLRDQIDGLRNTIETLRNEAERLDSRRKVAREKIGGRLDTIRARLDDIRRGN